MAGWPLIRSDETWECRHHWSDAGASPEGLAYKIEIFEAVDRQRGFEVRAPRIPAVPGRVIASLCWIEAPGCRKREPPSSAARRTAH